jgi:IMP dehydrogenase
MSTRKRKQASLEVKGKEAPELPFSPKALRLSGDEKMTTLNLSESVLASPKPSHLHHLVDSKFTLIYPTGVQVSPPNIKLLDSKADQHHAVTFDELTLADRPSNYHPAQVNLTSHITRNIYLKGCGFISAAMDTVTEMNMALEMAKNGGIGILHRNMSVEEQVSQVKWVRRKIHFGGMVSKPITFGPNLHYSEFQSEVAENRWPFTSFPVVNEEKKVLGLITRDQLEFVGDENPLLSDIMIPIAKIVCAPANTVSTDAYAIMHANKVKKLPVLDDDGCLQGMYVWNDVKADATKQNRFSLDKEGHFLVGAAIGVGAAELERADALVKAGCKLLVIDSSHGACLAVREIIQGIRERFGNTVEIIAGNVASYESAQYLLENEAGRPDGIKVGIGPGSICTTRKVTGHGIPQITAIYEAWKAIRDYGAKTGYYVPIIADGGIKSSGDIVKALAAGANGLTSRHSTHRQVQDQETTTI